MSAYRFCRTDDIALLVDALNCCWAPHFPDEPLMTPAAFKRSIRDLQVWCSSCMVAFSGADPVGVLIGARRPSGTLVHKIAVRPDHRRQDHGRHLLTSLGSKLAILGPPQLRAEVPEALDAARGLFSAGGYVHEAVLTDYVRQDEDDEAGEAAATPHAEVNGHGWLVIPITVDDVDANGLLGEAAPQTCWKRSVETLTAAKDDIAGLAVASVDRIEAYVLYRKPETALHGAEPAAAASAGAMEIVALRSMVEDDGARLRHLLARLSAAGTRAFRFPKVHPAEIPDGALATLGFRPDGRHLLYTARAAST